MANLLHLLDHRTCHGGVRITQRVRGDAGEEIGVGLALGIVEGYALAVVKRHGLALPEGIHVVFLIQCADLVQLHGDCSSRWAQSA